jgi:ABC exporter DevB family membrane fusion protein
VSFNIANLRGCHSSIFQRLTDDRLLGRPIRCCQSIALTILVNCCAFDDCQAVALAELEDAKAAVQQAKAQLNLAYVRSPRAGQILKIHTWPGEIIGNQGIVELGRTDQMYAIAEVYEADIHKVRLGQRAIITSAGFTM